MEKRLKKLLIIAIGAAVLTVLSFFLLARTGEFYSFGFPLPIVSGGCGTTIPGGSGCPVGETNLAFLGLDYFFFAVVMWILLFLAGLLTNNIMAGMKKRAIIELTLVDLVVAALVTVVFGLAPVPSGAIGSYNHGWPLFVYFTATIPTNPPTPIEPWNYTALFIDYAFYAVVVWIISIVAAHFMNWKG